MGKVKKCIGMMVAVLFLFNAIIPSMAFSQGEAIAVMSLPDGTAISMTPAQVSALAAQPGITIAATPVVGATQVAIPVPAALGGGYIVGTPATLASGLGATGIAAGVTASAIVGATVAAGTISAGALAGIVASLGIAGTVTAGAIVIGAALSGVVAVTGGGGGAAVVSHH